MLHLIPANSATAARRRMFFTLVDATDLVTPEDITVTGVKVSLSFDGGSPANSTNDIVKVSGSTGEYYIELTQSEANQTVGVNVRGSLAPSGCALSKMQGVIIDPVRGVGGPTALPNAAADAAGGLPISDAGGLDLDAQNAAVLQGRAWSGTLAAVTDTGIEFPGGYGISTQARILIEIRTAGAHFAKQRFAVYSGAGNVWTVDPAWNAGGETTPTGTPSAVAFAVPAEPTAARPQVDVVEVNGSAAPALVGGRFDAHVGSIADAVLTAAKFAAGAFDAVWSVAARLLTAGTNIVLAKGTGVTGFNDLSAAQVNAEADAALADVGVTTTVTGRIDAAITTRASQTSVDDVPTNAELATALGTADDAVLAQIALVKAKTDALPSDPADQSLIIAATDALMTALGDVPTNAELAAAVAAINAATEAALSSTARAELGTVPAANAPIVAKITWLAMLARNKIEQTASEQRLKADDGTTTVAAAPVADAAGVLSRGEFAGV